MEITWLGHSCFTLKNSEGTVILCDPYDPETIKPLSGIEADIVTVSHDHHDHNYVQAVKGQRAVIDLPGKQTVCGVEIVGYTTYHDKEHGKKRGKNIMFEFKLDSMRVLHSGDLGCIPDKQLIDEIGQIDVMLVPIGGVFTIDGDEAREFANLLKPKVLIPMHYSSEKLSFKLEGLEPFLSRACNCSVHRLNQACASIMPENLGEDRILVLKT